MRTTKKHRGYALLLFLTLLATATSTMTVKALNHNGNSQIARDKITAAALAKAKEALIGYAITYGETHPGNVDGYLPCPDKSGISLGGEGAAEGSCAAKNISAIGRFPWKTLDLPALRGGDNECLWYAVSGTYKYNIKTDLMNWDTNGQLQVYASDGTTLLTPADNQAVAVIFAPGMALSNQNRTGTTAPICGGNYSASNYLDAEGTFNNATPSLTAGANSAFRIGDIALNTSDHLAYITKQDIWNALQKRNNFLSSLNTLAQKTAECIASFGSKNNTSSNKSLPWPTRLTLSDYGATSSYNDWKNLYAGRVPYQVDTSKTKTGNNIGSDYLLTSSGANCPAGWANIYPWWDNWKDHLFYAIGQRFEPNNNPTNACDSDHCLSVNGSSHNNAAVVVFASQRLSGQTRISCVTDTQRGIASNYLEGRNASNIENNHANGNENYQTDATSGTFNDIVYCIKEDMSVVPGSATGCP